MSPAGERRTAPGAILVPEAELRTYYDRPVLKEPTWKWEIPAYFFVGGVAAGASMLAAAADLVHDDVLATRMRLTSAAAISTGGALLVADLGRPARFHHMLRVAKPTSPMNIGSWLLAAFGPASGVAAYTALSGKLRGVGRIAGMVAAALAPAVATYTAVIIADTAVPVWHDARRELPFVFAAGAAASAGAAGVVSTPPAHAAPARRLTVVGAVLELLTVRMMKRGLGPLIAEPYHRDRAGRLTSVAEALTLCGAALSAAGLRRRRTVARAGASLVLLGAALERFAIVEAGRQSARDPRYTVAEQRARRR